ncbi:MAG: YdcF family protein, partial [Chitinophagales bacterium]
AKNYAIKNNVPKEAILIEEKSKYTIENLAEAKSIMDSLKFETALLVSDPLHMKRSISLAQKKKITCFSSPTETSMYKSRKTKLQFLIYETFYFTLGKISGRN